MAEPSSGDGTPPAAPGGPGGAPVAHGPSFGWRGGLLLGVAVLVIVYAIAEATAWLPPLRDFVEHAPVAIAVLVVGTIAVLLVVLRGASRD